MSGGRGACCGLLNVSLGGFFANEFAGFFLTGFRGGKGFDLGLSGSANFAECDGEGFAIGLGCDCPKFAGAGFGAVESTRSVLHRNRFVKMTLN